MLDAYQATGTHKLIAYNAVQQNEQERLRGEISANYANCNAYRAASAETKALSAQFESLFGQRTGWATLDHLLRRSRQHQCDLLRVLARLDMQLDSNVSETEIWGYGKVRNISGSTHSDLGR